MNKGKVVQKIHATIGLIEIPGGKKLAYRRGERNLKVGDQVTFDLVKGGCDYAETVVRIPAAKQKAKASVKRKTKQ